MLSGKKAKDPNRKGPPANYPVYDPNKIDLKKENELGFYAASQMPGGSAWNKPAKTTPAPTPAPTPTPVYTYTPVYTNVPATMNPNLPGLPGKAEHPATLTSWLDNYGQKPGEWDKWQDAYGQYDFESPSDYYQYYRQTFEAGEPGGYKAGDGNAVTGNPQAQFYMNQLNRDFNEKSNKYQEMMDAWTAQQTANNQKLLDWLDAYLKKLEDDNPTDKPKPPPAPPKPPKSGSSSSSSSSGPSTQTDWLNDIYKKVLKRDADPTAYSYWKGATPAEVEAALMTSGEKAYLEKHGTNQGFSWTPTPPPKFSPGTYKAPIQSNPNPNTTSGSPSSSTPVQTSTSGLFSTSSLPSWITDNWGNN